MKHILIVLLKCFLTALFFFVLIAIALYFGIATLFYNSVVEDKATMDRYYETWFQIPSTGSEIDPLAIFRKNSRFSSFKNENEYGFGNVDDSCHTREDTYLVFNYHLEDSMFMFKYIDSLVIDTTMNRHILNFHLYYEDEKPNRTRYWELEYKKIVFDTLYNQDKQVILTHAINKQLAFTRFPEFSKNYPHQKSEIHEFVYDEKIKKFRLSEGNEEYYFRKKTGEWCKYSVTFYK